VQTIKTAVVVVMLLFVIYGGFIALNGTNTTLSPELEGLVDLDQNTPDITGVTGPFTPSTPTSSSGPAPADPWAAFSSAPTPGFGNSTTPASPPPVATPTPSAPPPLATNPTTNPAVPGLLSSNDAPKPPSNEANKTALSNELPPLPTLPPILSPNGKPSTPNAALLTAAPVEPKESATPDFGIAIPSTKTVDKELPSALLPSKADDSSSDAITRDPSELESEKSDSVPAPKLANQSYENAKSTAMDQIKRNQLKEALTTLTLFYDAPELTSDQRQDLLDLLDALAREVVYSRQHYLDIAYFSAPGETMEQIAKRYEVPADILAKINAVNPSTPLQPGTKLKVVPGPFRAEVNLERHELTLFVNELYAGRYPISTGNDPEPKPGTFKVLGKQRDRNYYGQGAPIAGTDPKNPYGGYWVDLGQDLCIHGTSEAGNPNQGCISLSPVDAADVYGMLSAGSEVTIRR
jgi:lipoprotein-anchoring transpeptidase ErfK/SrfK